jgi:uncharacterized membrane protein YdjX (TVP38/TMEM64 family)
MILAVNEESEKKVNKNLWKRLWPIILMFIAFAGIIIFDFDDFFNFETLKNNRKIVIILYDQHRFLVVSLLFIFYTLLVTLSVPGAVWLSLVAGFLMGTWAATLLVVMAATIGALGIFFIARYALFDFFQQKSGSIGRKMKAGFQKNELSYLLVLRLVPLFPFWLVNIAPALLGVSVRTFIVGTFLGIIPGTAVFCSMGNGLGVYFDQNRRPDLNILFEPGIIGPLLGLAALSLTPIILKRIKKFSKDNKP